MGLDQFVEILEFSLKDHLNELIVRVGVGKNEDIWKDFPVGNFSSEELNNDCSFLALNFKAFGWVWRFPDGLIQHIKSLSILSSDSSNSASIEEIFTKFVIVAAFGERTLLN